MDAEVRQTCTVICINDLVDFNFNLKANNNIYGYNTRSKFSLHLPHVRTNWGKQMISYQAATELNELD